MNRAPVLFLGLLCLPFLVALDDSPVWDTTEALYVQIPREIVESGNWLVPTFNGVPYFLKPPLTHWIIAPFYLAFGLDLYWERFVLALLAIGSVMATYYIGKQLFSTEVALLGTGLFATIFRFHSSARRLPMDCLVLLCALLAILFALVWDRKGQPVHLLLCGLFFGLGFLAKGPVALFPMAFLGLWFLLYRRERLVSQWGWVLLSGLLFFAVAFSWFLALGLLHDWEPVRSFFVTENIGRFVNVDFGPVRSPLFYIGVFLGDFFPWTLLLPAALVWFYRAWRSSLSRDDQRSLVLLAGWFLTYFVVFSFSLNKQDYYILPVYPAAALFVGFYLSNRANSRSLQWVVSTCLLLLAVLLFWLAHQIFPGSPLLWAPPVALAAAACLAWKRRRFLLILTLSGFYLMAFLTYQKPFERYRPIPGFAETVRQEVEGSGGAVKAGWYKFAAPSLRFYLDEDILEIVELETAIRELESTSTVFLIVDHSALVELQQNLAEPAIVVESRPRFYTKARDLLQALMGGKPAAGRSSRWSRDIYLISNRKPSV